MRNEILRDEKNKQKPAAKRTHLSEITPLSSKSIIDFMALVQSLRNTQFETF